MFPFYKFHSLPGTADLWAIPPVCLSPLSHFSSWERWLGAATHGIMSPWNFLQILLGKLRLQGVGDPGWEVGALSPPSHPLTHPPSQGLMWGIWFPFPHFQALASVPW